jgi:hypothetical protein
MKWRNISMILPEDQSSSDRLNFHWDSDARQSDIFGPLKGDKRDLGDFFLFLENFESRGNLPDEEFAVINSIFVL